MDTGAKSTAGGTDLHMEVVGEVDRAADAEGKAKGRVNRYQGAERQRHCDLTAALM